MSWSLQISNGDLAVGGAQLGQVSGGAKLLQDFRCALLEHMGHDELHPWYGSLIDGGRVNDQEQPSLVGSDDWNRTILAVESEIRRIAGQIQTQQQQRLESDRMTYGKPTLQPQEILMAVSDIQFFQAQDALLVRVNLTTGADQTLQVNVPLGTAATLT